MKHLLFVDDEQRVLEGLARMLRGKRDEWECEFATGVNEALTLMKNRDFQVIVSDLDMPHKSGLDFLKLLRADESLRYTPFLMLTGNGDSTVKKAVLEAGATDFLNKPIDFVELQVRLTNVLALQEFQDEMRVQNVILDRIVRIRTAALDFSRREIIYRLAKAAEARDTDTGNHILRVALAARLLAKHLGFDDVTQEYILLTSPLHDVGKIGISDAILRKAGPLTDAETAQMKMHCEIGADILTESIEPLLHFFGAQGSETHSNVLLEMAARIALHHHEHWDGTGYPQGLAGEDIPIEARIVAVADVYDALRSERCYKPSMGEDDSLRMIREASGTHFDPRIVEVLAEHFDEIEQVCSALRDQASGLAAAA